MMTDGSMQSDSVEFADSETRLIAMGHTELMLGFRLIGFETYPEASAADLEQLLSELIARREKAFVLLEPELARCKTPALERLRNEGGRIVITELPSLQAPQQYHPELEDMVRSVLGRGALGDLA